MKFTYPTACETFEYESLDIKPHDHFQLYYIHCLSCCPNSDLSYW